MKSRIQVGLWTRQLFCVGAELVIEVLNSIYHFEHASCSNGVVAELVADFLSHLTLK